MNYKVLIKKVILFILFTICAFNIYNIVSNIDKYGYSVFEEKEYIESLRFQEDFNEVIVNLESCIYNGVKIDNYNEKVFGYYENSNIEYIFVIETTDGKNMLISNIKNVNSEQYLTDINNNFQKNKIYYMCKLNEDPITNQDYMKHYQFHANQQVLKKLDVYIGINNFEFSDYIKLRKDDYESFSNNYKKYIGIACISGIIFIVLLVNLSIHKKELKNSHFFKKMYAEQAILWLVALVIYEVQLIIGLNYRIEISSTIIKLILYIVGYIIVSEMYFSIVKNGIKKDLLIPKIIENFKNMYKAIIVYIFICFIVIKMWSIYTGDISIYAFDLCLIFTIILLNYLSLLVDVCEISNKINSIRNGNLEDSVDCRNTELNMLTEGINQIKDGMKKAVDKNVKSEKLKTDLITNVSHDLKTPITSIINYTDLLKREQIKNDNAQKYIGVLEEKSKQLKSLVEELIEISKVSSGTEVANFEKINFKELVLQANGEFTEKFEQRNLVLISNLINKDIICNLDGIKMWRVLENLYQNVYKHALENTRVYVDLIEQDGNIIFSIKNVSKEKLNISPDELMERFIMGDSSRHNGGNGLGLSISKELVALNNGELKLEIDGDLFIAKIIFKFDIENVNEGSKEFL